MHVFLTVRGANFDISITSKAIIKCNYFIFSWTSNQKTALAKKEIFQCTIMMNKKQHLNILDCDWPQRSIAATIVRPLIWLKLWEFNLGKPTWVLFFIFLFLFYLFFRHLPIHWTLWTTKFIMFISTTLNEVLFV